MFHRRRKKSVPMLIISRFFGLLVLFIIIAGFNYFDNKINDNTFHALTIFINQNILLLVLITLIFLIGDIFGVLPFPVNLPAPIFNATGAVFMVAFIFRIFGLIQDLTLENSFDAFKPLAVLIYIIVFLIVLAVGYIKIFIDLFRMDECGDGCGRWTQQKIKDESPAGTSVPPQPETIKDNPTWRDVGEQFRATMYDALLAARKSMKEEREKNK